VVFIESKPFSRLLLQLPESEELLAHIQRDLLDNPSRGDVVPGLGGIRKARAANPGRSKGKRGGFRYLFLYLERKQHIHLLILLSKGEQEDLTSEQRRVLRQLVGEIKA
jgi:hypothetical protein